LFQCYLRCIGISFDLVIQNFHFWCIFVTYHNKLYYYFYKIFQFDFSTKQYGTALLSAAEDVIGDDDDDEFLQKSMGMATECQTSSTNTTLQQI
jgi:hypothetical protein